MTTIRDAITQYVTFRPAAGSDFRATAELLDAFCRAIGPDIEIATIPAARVQAF